MNEVPTIFVFEIMSSSGDELLNECLLHFLFCITLKPHVSILTLLHHEVFHLFQVGLDIKFLQHILGDFLELLLGLSNVGRLKVLSIVGKVRLALPINFTIVRAYRLQFLVFFTEVHVELDKGFNHIFVDRLPLAILVYQFLDLNAVLDFCVHAGRLVLYDLRLEELLTPDPHGLLLALQDVVSIDIVKQPVNQHGIHGEVFPTTHKPFKHIIESNIFDFGDYFLR